MGGYLKCGISFINLTPSFLYTRINFSTFSVVKIKCYLCKCVKISTESFHQNTNLLIFIYHSNLTRKWYESTIGCKKDGFFAQTIRVATSPQMTRRILLTA